MSLWAALREGLLPDDPLGVAEWADRHRYLPSSTSAEPGLYRSDRTPYAIEPMERLGPDDPCHTVALQWGSQLGKSEIGNNLMGWVCAQSPGPLLMVQPTVEDAESYSRGRLQPMIDACPALADRIAPSRSRDSGNTLLEKAFPGGFWKIVGSNAPSKLASTPIRRVFLDEVDRFPANAGGEGDPVRLAIQRTATFANRKVLLTSTPTIEGFSRIERAYLDGDRRRFWVPCPECDTYQVLHWRPKDGHGGVVWPVGRPDLAGYQCGACGVILPNSAKNMMLPRGEWRPEVLPQPGEPPRQPSYHLSSLYSPHGWVSWADLAQEFVEAAGDPERMRVFVNTKLAETFKSGAETAVAAAGLASRAEVYPAAVPPGVVILTAGVDVQDDRLEVEIVGWGAGEESWSIAWHLIPGDPSGPEIWRELAEFLRREWSGSKVAAACIDSGGHHTQAVYQFATAHQARRWWAVKGVGGPRPVWPRRPTRRKSGALLYAIGVDAAKESVYARLRLTSGPGALHFPSTHPPEYYTQLTAERLEVSHYKGRQVRKWTLPPGRRNEALDCRVYAYAALQGLIASGYRLPAAALAPTPAPAHTVAEVAPAPAMLPPAPPAPVPHRSKPKRPSIYADVRR